MLRTSEEGAESCKKAQDLADTVRQRDEEIAELQRGLALARERLAEQVRTAEEQKMELVSELAAVLVGEVEDEEDDLAEKSAGTLRKTTESTILRCRAMQALHDELQQALRQNSLSTVLRRELLTLKSRSLTRGEERVCAKLAAEKQETSRYEQFFLEAKAIAQEQNTLYQKALQREETIKQSLLNAVEEVENLNVVGQLVDVNTWRTAGSDAGNGESKWSCFGGSDHRGRIGSNKKDEVFEKTENHLRENPEDKFGLAPLIGEMSSLGKLTTCSAVEIAEELLDRLAKTGGGVAAHTARTEQLQRGMDEQKRELWQCRGELAELVRALEGSLVQEKTENQKSSCTEAGRPEESSAPATQRNDAKNAGEMVNTNGPTAPQLSVSRFAAALRTAIELRTTAHQHNPLREKLLAQLQARNSDLQQQLTDEKQLRAKADALQHHQLQKLLTEKEALLHKNKTLQNLSDKTEQTAARLVQQVCEV